MTLKLGSTGDAVLAVQQKLAALGYTLNVDGVFDVTTDAAVRAFQVSRGLPVTGAVAGLTAAALVATDPSRNLGNDR